MSQKYNLDNVHVLCRSMNMYVLGVSWAQFAASRVKFGESTCSNCINSVYHYQVDWTNKLNEWTKRDMYNALKIPHIK